MSRGGIVVGYDASTKSVSALAWAAALAVRRSCQLTVLYAAEYGGLAASMGADIEGLAEQVADEGAGRARALAGTDAVSVRSVSCVGGATASLVEASETAELVVVGNRGRGTLVGALLGSVAFSVTAAAHCPVVVVRHARPEDPGSGGAVLPGPGYPVVVGVDGSPGAFDAVEFAAGIADSSGAILRVVAAWTSPEVADAGFAVLDIQAFTDAAQWTARDAAKLAADVARVRFSGLDVHEVVVQEPSRQALVNASRSAGLVVVGARGHGDVSGLFLGSVSHATIHGAQCPVAVVRHRA